MNFDKNDDSQIQYDQLTEMSYALLKLKKSRSRFKYIQKTLSIEKSEMSEPPSPDKGQITPKMKKT